MNGKRDFSLCAIQRIHLQNVNQKKKGRDLQISAKIVIIVTPI